MEIQPVVPGGENSGIITLTKSGTVSYTVPAGELWLLNWLEMIYVSDATVATRYVRARARMTGGSSGPASIVLCGGSVTASQTKQYQFGVGNAGGTMMDKDNAMMNGYPLVLVAGMVLEVAVDAGAPAGDDWTAYFHVFQTRTDR